MLSTVLRTIAAHALFERGDRVIVAVSGGPDSMALLHVLWEARERLGLTLEVAGVDHGLRPAAARRAGRSSRARAAALGLPFVRLSRRRRAARRRGASSAGRRPAGAPRRRWRRWRPSGGARRIALGHQADDQAETVLFRIVRGTGLRGAARDSLPPRRRSSARCSTCGARRSSATSGGGASPSSRIPRTPTCASRGRGCATAYLPLLRRGEPARRRGAGGAGGGGARTAPRDASRDDLVAPALPRRVAAAVERLRARGGTAARRRRGRAAGGDLVRRRPGRARARRSAPRAAPSAPARHRRARAPIAGRPARST